MPISPRIVEVLPGAILGLWLLALLTLFRGLLRVNREADYAWMATANREADYAWMAPANREADYAWMATNRTWSVSLLAAAATLWATVEGTFSAGQSLYIGGES